LGRVTTSLIDLVRSSVIGDDEAVEGPYGLRRVTYVDYTASGRSLSFIEDFLRHHAMPLYANTHSDSSRTGLQTTRFREDARAIIARSVGAAPTDAVIFCGSGATGAISLLQRAMGLGVPAGPDRRWPRTGAIAGADRPVVFVGPYEHHANEVSWRETVCDVVTIAEDADGRIDLDDLRARLAEFAGRALKIGSFSAASNVTGILSDVRAIASLLHAHGAISLWDYAAAGPYVAIDMHPAGDALAHLDGVFLSPHKFIGGPGTPGVLVAARALFTNAVPVVPAGGTVLYVGPEMHGFIADVEHREEGGTPAILESIRAGLVFQLKDAVGAEVIRAREESFVRRAIARWGAHPKLRILGNPALERLSILSMLVRHGAAYLHWNFVVALLNDLFGIQSRGGCSCAGPYGHRLFHIDEATAERYYREVQHGAASIKPGWFRVNFNYFLSEEVFEFVVEAVLLVAEHGWRLLPDYDFDVATGRWTHRRAPRAAPMSLRDVRYTGGRMEFRARHATEPLSALRTYLDDARATFAAAGARAHDVQAPPAMSAEYQALRWFPLPHEVARDLRAAADAADDGANI
jgi:selenocysteine lyase/cysteine desulfurase